VNLVSSALQPTIVVSEEQPNQNPSNKGFDDIGDKGEGTVSKPPRQVWLIWLIVTLLLEGGALCYLPWMTADLFGDVSRPWYVTGLIFAAIVILVAHIVYSVAQKFPSLSGRVWGIGGVILAGLLVVVIVRAIYGPAKASNPATVPNPPSLEPTLVIDSVSQSNVCYHYEIRNEGGKTAYQIRYSESGEGAFHVMGRATVGARAHELAPGRTMQISMPIPQLEMPSYELSKTLVLFYCDNASTVSNQFCEEFRFFGQRELLRVGALHFETSRTVPEPAPPSAKELEGVMTLEKASFGFVFPETDKGTPSKCFVQSTNRFLDIDIPQHRVMFWSLNAGGEWVKLSQEVKTNGGMHILLLSWNRSGAMLSLDGERVCQPVDFVKP
jgi:hypothetical protein